MPGASIRDTSVVGFICGYGGAARPYIRRGTPHP